MYLFPCSQPDEMGCFLASIYPRPSDRSGTFVNCKNWCCKHHYNKAFTLGGINFRFFYTWKTWKKQPMPSYRLLRSNKESGPYALNDLVALGLKPYDLVWVDGRSAAWRYPSEITELKEYAPVVEEQPYDRFYKKPSEEAESAIKEPVASSNSEIKYQATINESFAKQEPAKNILEKPIEEKPGKTTTPEIPKPYQTPEPKKKVFVSMPETNAFEPFQNSYKGSEQYDQHKYDQHQYEQYLPKPKHEEVKPQPIDQRSYSPISVQQSEETRLETKYTQSLDDIKEMYINTLVQRKTKNRRKEITKKLRPVLIPALLLAAGFAIGYVIKTKKSPFQASQATVIPQQSTTDQKKIEPDPWNSLVPVLVTTFTTDEPERPSSAENRLVAI